VSVLSKCFELNGILAACAELGIGLVPWSPVGAGFLTAHSTAPPSPMRRRILHRYRDGSGVLGDLAEEAQR
jgi:aryl-alcohol dehydrogenase-like predicted oxidoreductase